LDGSEFLTARGECKLTIEDAVALGQRVAEELKAKGAARLIAAERDFRQAAEQP
jgi:hypothetical protein